MKFGNYVPVEERTELMNERYVFQFANGHGASVIRNQYSYGGLAGFYELAVLKDGKINYKTKITDDVLGYLEPDDVTDILKQIENLKGMTIK